MKHKQETLNLDHDLELTIQPDFQTTEFVITGQAEAVLPIADHIKVLDAKAPAQTRPVSHVEAPLAHVALKSVYEDFSTLEHREVLRRKMSAWLHDRKYGTNMLGLLNERIADDRDVAFARQLGILGVTHCARHEKAVAKLKSL